MKKYLLLMGTVLLAAACSSPKYTYNFDYYNYNSGRKQEPTKTVVQVIPEKEVSPLAINESMLLADAAETPIVLAENKAPVVSGEEAASILARKYKSMTKEERKEFKQALKKEFKNYVKSKKDGDHVAAANATNVMDQDLKMAIIFGAVGLTLSLFGGVNTVFWVVGVIAIVVGVVFLVRWLSRQ